MGEEHTPAVGQERQTVVIRPVVAGDTTAEMTRRRLPSLPRPTHAIVAALTLAAVVAGGVAVSSSRSSLEVEGIVDGQRFTRRDLPKLTLRVTSAGAGADDVRLEVNGDAVALSEDGNTLVVGAEALGEVIVEGRNTLVVTQPGRFGLGGSTVERTFTFDPIGPLLMVPAAVLAPTPERPTVVRGLVDGAAALTANGQTVTIEPGGAFTVAVARGTAAVALVATDAEGNPAEATVLVTAEPPLADYPSTAAVHVTAHSWKDPAVREPILEMARRGLINAVELDIKDESGEVGLRQHRSDRRRGGRGDGALRRGGGARRVARTRRTGDRTHRMLPRPGARLVGMGQRAHRDDRATGLGRSVGDRLRDRRVHQRRQS